MTDVTAVAKQLEAIAALKKAEVDAQAQADVPETAKAGMAALGLLKAVAANSTAIADDDVGYDEYPSETEATTGPTLEAFLMLPTITVTVTVGGRTGTIQI